MALLNSLKKFCDFLDPIVKLLFIPVSVVCLYAGTAWLDRNYVSKQYFNGEFQKENRIALEGMRQNWIRSLSHLPPIIRN
jgi:hypothetical protein